MDETARDLKCRLCACSLFLNPTEERLGEISVQVSSVYILFHTPTEERLDGRSSSGSQSISVQVSSPSGLVVDSSEHAALDQVVEGEGEVEADRASMSSSLQQEDDILLPSGNLLIYESCLKLFLHDGTLERAEPPYRFGTMVRYSVPELK